MKRLLLSFLLVATLLPTLHADTLTPEEYAILAHDCRVVVDKAKPTPDEARALLTRLEVATAIPKHRVDHAFATEYFRQLASSKKAVVPNDTTRRVFALWEETADTKKKIAPLGTDAIDATERVNQILKQKEFQEESDTKAQKPSSLEEKLQEWWDRLINGAGNRKAPEMPGGLQYIGPVIRVLLYCLLISVVVYALYRSWPLLKEIKFKLWRRKDTKDTLFELDLEEENLPDPLGAAQTAQASGDFRLAVRYTYIACLRLLRDKGYLTFERGKTNGDYQRSLRKFAGIFAALNPLTLLFDRLWYGEQPASSTHYEQSQAIFTQIEALPSLVTPKTEGAP
jgi:hypothetical protein